MKLVGLIGTLLVILLMTACANQPPPSEETWDGSLSLPQQKAMGFVVGLFQIGFVAPFAFIGSLFADVRIYAFPNAGRWYDLGFLLGLSAWGGGGVAAVKKAP